MNSEKGYELLLAIEAQIKENGGINATLDAIDKEWKSAIITRSNHRKWTQDEYTSLRLQIRNRVKDPIIPGRSKSAITNKIEHIRQRNKLSKGRETWSKAETSYLKRCVTTGVKPDLPGRSIDSILRKMGRLRLSTVGLGLHKRVKL